MGEISWLSSYSLVFAVHNVVVIDGLRSSRYEILRLRLERNLWHHGLRALIPGKLALIVFEDVLRRQEEMFTLIREHVMGCSVDSNRVLLALALHLTDNVHFMAFVPSFLLKLI